jgi:CRISPR-associated protein Csx17
MSAELRLPGCAPEPLQSYGKALGVLRLVAEQRDPTVRAHWDGDTFVLTTDLRAEDLVRFLADEYAPTPIIAPWNQDSGFYGSRQSLKRIEANPDPRLSAFREAIRSARDALTEVGLLVDGRPVPKDALGKRLPQSKGRLISLLRARLPDAAASWLDAVVVVARDEPAYPPLFGAGGTDGRFEFSDAFMNALALILAAPDHRAGALEAALFAAPLPAVEPMTSGMLAPASVGGPNAGEGFEAKESNLANPWDLVLGIEGLLLLAASAARKFGSQFPVRAVFPFVVGQVAAGHPTAGDEGSKGEVWVPLWERPATLAELRHVFREARAEWNTRPARTGVDIARALVSLGVDRGLTEFRRYGLQNRSGRSYLATPLGRFRVTWRPNALLLAEIDPFLDGLAPLRGGKETPAAVDRLLRGLDEAILAYCTEGDRARLLDVLAAAAATEMALARRPSLRARGRPLPVPPLSRQWVHASNDGSAEFSLAAAVASLMAGAGGKPGPTRQHLVPVERAGDRWRWAENPSRSVVWTGRDAVGDLGRILARRLLEARQTGIDVPLQGAWRADLSHIGALIRGEVDAQRLGRLIEALSLIDWWRPDEHAPSLSPARLWAAAPSPTPASYAFLKLTTLGQNELFAQLGARVAPQPDPRTIGLLRAGHVWEAARLAARRLRAAGLDPAGWEAIAAERWALRSDPTLGRRLLAALIVPVQPVESIASLALDLGQQLDAAQARTA